MFWKPMQGKRDWKIRFSVVKEKMRDLSSNQINFERERDPVGEKVHQNRSGGLHPQRGAARFARRPPLWVPILVVFSPTGSFSLSKLIWLLLKSRIFSLPTEELIFQSILPCKGSQTNHFERLKLTNKIDSTLSRPFGRTNPLKRQPANPRSHANFQKTCPRML